MKSKTAIHLTVVLLVIVGLIVVRHTDLFKPTPPSEEERPAESPIWEPIGDATELVIEPADGAKIRFARDGDDWRIVEPIDSRAWAYMVEDLVHRLKSFDYKKVFAPGDAEAPGTEVTGLDKPGWTLMITDGAGAARVLEIGRTVPLSGGQQTYVRPAGSEKTFVVDVDFARRLGIPLKEFRNRIVVEIDNKLIVRIRIEGQQTVELNKRDGRWGVTHPVSAAADETEVGNLLRKLGRFKVKEFLDDAPKSLRAYGLEPGKERLVVRYWAEAEPPAPTPATTSAPTTAPKPLNAYAIAMGNKKHTEGERYAKLLDAPGVFLVRVTTIDDLQPSLLSLRDKKLLPVEADNVVRVELDIASGEAELVRKDDTWRMVQPFQGLANADAVSELLDELNDLKAESFRDDVVAPGGFGLDPEQGRITIHEAGKSDKQTLLLGMKSPSGEMTFAKRAASDAVAVVKTTALTPLLADPVGYWDPIVFELPPDITVTRIKLTRPDGEFLLDSEAGEWSMTAPLSAATDADNVNKLLDQIELLVATKIVSLGKDLPARYAKAADRIVVELEAAAPASATLPATAPATQPSTAPSTQPTTAPAPRRYVVRVAKIGRKAYAWTDHATPVAVGEFDDALFDALSVELRDRSVWRITPKKIKAIRLAVGDDTLELRLDEKRWKYSADPYVKIDPKKVKSFLEGIEELQTERFASHSADAAKEAKFALDGPWFTLTLTDSEGEVRRIVVSGEGPDQTKTRYASAKGVRGVLVLSGETAAKMVKKLDDFKE